MFVDCSWLYPVQRVFQFVKFIDQIGLWSTVLNSTGYISTSQVFCLSEGWFILKNIAMSYMSCKGQKQICN